MTTTKASGAPVINVPRRRSRGVDPAHTVYEIDLWLIDSDPPIWRSLIVPAELTLAQLHDVIQIAMGWHNCHMHNFETKSGSRYESGAQMDVHAEVWGPDDSMATRSEDEARVTLRDAFDALKETLAYVYDFGDDWLHGIKLIKTHADRSAFDQTPMCLAGERAAPPEDCGGMWGFYEKLDILANPDPKDEWHQEVIEWMGGGSFDPDHFHRPAINTLLKGCCAPAPRRRK